MTEVRFNPGDKVQVRTGSLGMTFLELDAAGDAVCTWIQKKGKGYITKTGTFPLMDLIPYKRTGIGAPAGSVPRPA